jgi:hypothetical protein
MRPRSTRGLTSRLTTIRLPYTLDEALKAYAAELGRPWQTVLKEILADALGLELNTPEGAEVVRRSSIGLHVAVKKLHKPR